MTILKSISLTLLLIILVNCSAEDRTEQNETSYFGQTPPGLTPELFAPGIVSTGGIEILGLPHPNGREFYFTVLHPSAGRLAVMVSKLENDQLTKPQAVSFSSAYYDSACSISADGQKLFFLSLRPEEEGGKEFSFQNIWSIEREGDGWGKPRMLPPPINSEARDLSPSVTKDGTLYFNSTRGEVNTSYRSRLKNGRYSPLEKVQDILRTEMNVIEVAVDPDERYMVFVSFEGQDFEGGMDLYASFNNGNDDWSTPIKLPSPVNTPASENFPILSADGKFLFFSSDRVSEKYSGKDRANMTPEELTEIDNSPQNGRPDIYWVDVRLILNLKQRKNT